MTALRQHLPTVWPLTGRGEIVERGAEILADPAMTGVLVRGTAGAGKSRVGSEIAAALESAGTPVVRVSASPALQSTPLGALLPMLPLDGDPADPGPSIERQLAAAGARTVVFVDDAHDLDDESAALLARALARGGVAFLATMRTGAAMPDPLTAAWRSGHAIAVELAPLDRQATDTLLHRVCGGPVDAGASSEFWNLALGNPLFLRELVIGSTATGAFRADESDGVWRLVGRVEPSPMLREVVLGRLAHTQGRPREALDALCVADSMGSEWLARWGSDVVAELETDGWIAVEPSQRRVQVTLLHPLYTEILREGLGLVRRRALALEHVHHIEAVGARRRTDPLLLARLRLDAEGQAPPATLIAGARDARNRHDHLTVERLARAAMLGAANDDDRIAAGQLLGDALFELGGFAEAEVVLRAADDKAVDADQRLRIALARVTNLFWGLGALDHATSVVDAAIGEQRGTNAAELRALRAAMQMYAGDLRAALDLEHADDGGSDYCRAAFDAVVAIALTVAGRTGDALTAIDRGSAAHGRIGDLLATAHPGIHVVNRVYALIHAGRLDEAEQLATAGWEFSLRERAIIGQIWFAAQLGDLALHRGRLTTARQWFARQAERCTSGGHRLQLQLAHTGTGVAAGMQRDAPAADAAAAAYATNVVGWFRLFEGEAARAAAWRAVAHNQPADAHAILRGAAEWLRDTGIVTQEAAVLHDLARLGPAADVAVRLGELAARSDSPLVAAFALHAQALATGDLEALTAAGTEFQRLGTLLYAAEALSVAAHVAAAAGDQRAAAALRRRVDELAPSLEGCATPRLVLTDAVVPLSAREREIADLAALGAASRDIAEQLFLSVRTVNNHLQNIYTKLGITSRRDLRNALGRTEPP